MSEAAFWSEMEDIRTAMLAIGKAPHVPMTAHTDVSDRAIWFITARGTDLEQAAEPGAEASLIVTGREDMHARIEAVAAVVQDRSRLERMWSPVVAAWFDGIDDPDICLIRVEPRRAEVWLPKGGMGFAWEIAKARATGDKPHAGEHFDLTFGTTA